MHRVSSFQDNSILTYQEATAKLSKLATDTEEFRQLQRALSQTAHIVEIGLQTSTYKVETFLKESQLLGGFGSSEHFEIGKLVNLREMEGKVVLTKGKTKVLFEHIIALAGDFYGVYDGAISLPGGLDKAKIGRFQEAFKSLEQADSHELEKIIQQIEDEHGKVKFSSTPHHCYSYQMIEKNNAIKKIKGDIDLLLIDNSDHFSKDAKEAYRIGHLFAMQEAKKAGLKKDKKGLERAYALDAFACHFLTDLFAAGHIRNQRGELEMFLIDQLGFEKKFAKPLAGLLTGAQHEQDGNGLNVFTRYNGELEEWRAYGDGRFFSPENGTNRVKVIAAVQQSVNEVFEAYEHPEQDVISIVSQLIPCVTALNPPPLYTVEGDELFLNGGSEKIPIRSSSDFIFKAVDHAIGYLPPEYIDGVLSLEGISSIMGFPHQRSNFIEKVIFPMTERITGSIWRMMGLATSHQIKKQFRQQNDQLDEMANAIGATFKNTEEIIKKISKINQQLTESTWNTIYDEIKGSIDNILDEMHAYPHKEDQRKIAVQALINARKRISRVFTIGTSDGRKMLEAYRDMLILILQIKKDFEIKARVTLWFRQILALQVDAFCLYAILDKTNESLQKEAIEFEKDIFSQIENNINYIDTALIYQSEQYIEMQISKDKIREKSRLLLGSYASSHSEGWKIDNTNPIDQVEGCIGYPNIGNSCYMNAVLQILNAFPEGFPIKNTQADPFLEQLLKLRLYSKQGHPIDEEMLRQLRKVTFAIKNRSELTEGIDAQQDAHEFLLFVLNKMEWDSGLKLRLWRKGLHLEFQRDYEEVRKDILISINGETFQEILDKNFQIKMMSDLSDPWRCTVNGEERTFDRWNERLEIRQHPSHLIIHLERFKYDSKTGIRTKVTQKIQFPKNHRVVIGGKEYAIVGFINHQGNTSVSGHYTADIRKEEGTWIRYDDLSTAESQFQDIDKNAYIVILKQKI